MYNIILDNDKWYEANNTGWEIKTWVVVVVVKGGLFEKIVSLSFWEKYESSRFSVVTERMEVLYQDLLGI